MEQTLTWTNFYNHPRFWRHAIPWLIVFLFFYLAAFIIGHSENDEQPLETPFTVFLVIGEFLFLVYASFYAFNTLYTKRKKKLQFAIVLVLIIVVVSGIDHFLNSNVIQLGNVEGFWANVILFPFVTLVAFGLKLFYHGTKQVTTIEKLEAKQLESELKLLKSQVNPHFLFNTLNNIYSTNLEDHEKANEIILELSDLLRYQLESTNKKYSSLANEINSLENYIDLERIRLVDSDIKIEKNGAFEKVEILPLLLLPFVENAFKYGTGIEAGRIHIKFDLDENNLFHFYISNKIVQRKGKVHSGGIGLENVKKRLALMYPNSHELDIQSSESDFIVNLKVQL